MFQVRSTSTITLNLLALCGIVVPRPPCPVSDVLCFDFVRKVGVCPVICGVSGRRQSRPLVVIVLLNLFYIPVLVASG